VDPEGAGEGQLTIQLDRAIYAHYSPMVQWLLKGKVTEVSINDVVCDIVEISDGVSVGLPKDLRKVIRDQETVGVRDDCFRRVSDFFDSMEGFQGLSEGEKVSMGGDGVVVVLSDEYVQSFDPEVDRAL